MRTSQALAHLGRAGGDYDDGDGDEDAAHAPRHVPTPLPLPISFVVFYQEFQTFRIGLFN